VGALTAGSSDRGFECRLCGSQSDHVLLDLGSLPLANDFVRSPDDDIDRHLEPVVFVMCDQCRLLQLRDLVAPRRMFETYLWTSSSSDAAREHAARFARMVAGRYPAATNRFLVELASNDGLLLKSLADEGYRVLGVDPSNLADEATAAGLPTVRAFFAEDIARQILEENGPADVVVARNVIGHVADLRGFLAGVRTLLRPGGAFIVESPYAHGLRGELQYDTIFHEHVSYFTITTLAEALRRFGLAPTDTTFVPMNGGSFLCHALRSDDAATAGGLDALYELERVFELNEPRGWAWYAAAVEQQRERLRAILAELATGGHTVAGYGAAAKAMTMFNYCALTPELVTVIADGNPRKQGLLCPGVRIPVVSPDELLALKPDYVLIAAWNFTQEIAGHLRAKNYAGRFLVPLPVPRVL
jgi:SAM-dependent methyltransferase